MRSAAASRRTPSGTGYGKDDPLRGIRRTLRQSIESLSDKQVAGLAKKLEEGDPTHELAIARSMLGVGVRPDEMVVF
jgi:hypothetical protein